MKLLHSLALYTNIIESVLNKNIYLAIIIQVIISLLPSKFNIFLVQLGV